jgi:hypothetical protein
MFSLPQSRENWDTDAFDSVLKQELYSLDADMLPLQQGLRHSSYAVSDKLTITILNKNEDDENIIVKVGLFYNGIIAGCNCADDPTPVDEINEYCDALICINKQTAEATARLVN